MSILLESSSSSSAGPVVEVVVFAVPFRTGPGLVFGVFSDHPLGVLVGVDVDGLVEHSSVGLGVVVIDFGGLVISVIVVGLVV